MSLKLFLPDQGEIFKNMFLAAIGYRRKFEGYFL